MLRLLNSWTHESFKQYSIFVSFTQISEPIFQKNVSIETKSECFRVVSYRKGVGGWIKWKYLHCPQGTGTQAIPVRACIASQRTGEESNSSIT